ncbi:MAG: hypothetical protein GXY42_06280 [Desulfovibrionales bacterium]|nr:hypothetical protein [Desulfovibrionales bacterium]
MVVLKLAAILLALGLYFRLLVYGPWYEHIDIQAALLIGLLVINTFKGGIKGTRQVFGFVLPFVLSLLAFGALFQWMGLLGRSDWLADSLIKALVFPNSVLAVKLCLQAITFRDIVILPLPNRVRRLAIVLKAVMEKCTPVLHRHRFFMDLSPHFEGRRWAKLQRLGGVIVAAYISLYRETEKTVTLIEHRRSYVRKQQ